MIGDKIKEVLEMLPTLTKHEADIIEIVLKWDEELKMAFLFAKKMFEQDLQEDAVSLEEESKKKRPTPKKKAKKSRK